MTEPAKHTPGPWVGFSDRGRLFAIMPAGREGDVCQFSVPPTDADGHLMTAAPDLLAALQHVRKLIVEGAMTGFNYKDGDWAEKLFNSQALSHAAVSKALGGRS